MIRFSRSDADVFAPDETPPELALGRTTHLCIGAHQDDIEIMAYSGIAECLPKSNLHFTGVVATDGAGSPRTGKYEGMPDDAMRTFRREEQRRAARIGKYNLQIQLAHTSAGVRRRDSADLNADLDLIFGAAKPQVVYLHNLADSHDTHIALALRCLEAIRRLPPKGRPAQVLGCEVWRTLDWLMPGDKVALDTSANPDLARKLLEAFESQISGGKRYDTATLGRRAANATFGEARAVDRAVGVTFAMDLTPLIADGAPDIVPFTAAFIDRLKSDVVERLRRFQ